MSAPRSYAHVADATRLMTDAGFQRFAGEFLRDAKARAERVLDGSQTDQYTKRALAHDLIKAVDIAYIFAEPVVRMSDAMTREHTTKEHPE